MPPDRRYTRQDMQRAFSAGLAGTPRYGLRPHKRKPVKTPAYLREYRQTERRFDLGRGIRFFAAREGKWFKAR